MLDQSVMDKLMLIGQTVEITKIKKHPGFTLKSMAHFIHAVQNNY